MYLNRKFYIMAMESHPLSKTDSNYKNMYSKSKSVLENSGWMRLAVDDSSPRTAFFLLKGIMTKC